MEDKKKKHPSVVEALSAGGGKMERGDLAFAVANRYSMNLSYAYEFITDAVNDGVCRRKTIGNIVYIHLND